MISYSNADKRFDMLLSVAYDGMRNYGTSMGNKVTNLSYFAGYKQAEQRFVAQVSDTTMFNSESFAR